MISLVDPWCPAGAKKKHGAGGLIRDLFSSARGTFGTKGTQPVEGPRFFSTQRRHTELRCLVKGGEALGSWVGSSWFKLVQVGWVIGRLVQVGWLVS